MLSWVVSGYDPVMILATSFFSKSSSNVNLLLTNHLPLVGITIRILIFCPSKGGFTNHGSTSATSFMSKSSLMMTHEPGLPRTV